MSNDIKIYGQDAYDGVTKAGQLASKVLDYITPYVVAGVSTGELDEKMHSCILKHDAVPAPLNYRGYPKATCISINEVICHGIPDYSRILRPADILNIDVTVIVDGWYGDTSRMFYVDYNNAPAKAKRLVDVTYECLFLGMQAVKPGNTFGDIGYAIQKYAESHKMSVVRDFVGHGIGRNFHEPPNVFHYGKKGEGPILKEGMIFTIEPMINLGKYHSKILKDNWTAVTKDKSLSAQVEHTLMVTKDGYHVFTLSSGENDFFVKKIKIG